MTVLRLEAWSRDQFADLIDELDDWRITRALPRMSAYQYLAHKGLTRTLTKADRKYLRGFIRRWESRI